MHGQSTASVVCLLVVIRIHPKLTKFSTISRVTVEMTELLIVDLDERNTARGADEDRGHFEGA